MRQSVRYLLLIPMLGYAAGCTTGLAQAPTSEKAPPPAATGTAVVQRRDVTQVLRLHGTVEAENAAAVVVPRIMGQNLNALVVTVSN